MYIYRLCGETVHCLGWMDGWAIVSSDYRGTALIPPWDICNFNELWRLT